MRNILIIITIMALASCQEQPDFESTGLESLLIGSWSQSEYEDTTLTLKRVNSLPDDDYGIAFLSDGELREWKNVGWCGTPPITYGEFEGTWEITGDSVVEIQTTYWGGEIILKWHILEINQKKLVHWIDHAETLYIEEIKED